MANRNTISEWSTIKLGDICDKITNGTSAKQYEEEVGLPISRIETIWNGQFDFSRVKYIEENGKDFVDKYSLRENDILFSHINSDIHLGKTAIYKRSKYPTIIHGINLLLLRPKASVNADFLNYQLKYLRAKGTFISIAQKSVNQSSINQSKLKNIEITIVPLNQQQLIVSKIEELFSKLDNGVESLKTLQQQLKVYRQAVLKWAFEGRLTNDNVKDGELPEGWEWKKLGDLMQSVKNGYSKKPDEQGFFKILRISSVRPNKIDLNDCRLLESDIGIDFTVSENDLLFTRYNGSTEFVGVCSLVPFLTEKRFYPDKLIRCRPKTYARYHSAYIAYASNCGDARKFVLSKIKTSAGQTGISGGEIKEIPIPLAPTKEQEEIVQEIESRLSVCDKIEETINNGLKEAEAIRQSILKQAFEGKLV